MGGNSQMLQTATPLASSLGKRDPPDPNFIINDQKSEPIQLALNFFMFDNSCDKP